MGFSRHFIFVVSFRALSVFQIIRHGLVERFMKFGKALEGSGRGLIEVLSQHMTGGID
jgi:hypothetical protein